MEEDQEQSPQEPRVSEVILKAVNRKVLQRRMSQVRKGLVAEKAVVCSMDHVTIKEVGQDS